MNRAFCNWKAHSASQLAILLDLRDLSEEPDLRFENREEMTTKNICRVADHTTLFVCWKHRDPLEISVQLINGNVFSKARIEMVSDGAFVSGLSRHVTVSLHCGQPFATIEWQWTRNRPPKATPNLFGKPYLQAAERVEMEPAGSEERLRRIFQECLGVVHADSFDRWHHAAKGAIRALLLKKLGADIEITEQVIERLNSGQFKDHFAEYWVQMRSVCDYLRDDYDWKWAAKHTLPPRGVCFGVGR